GHPQPADPCLSAARGPPQAAEGRESGLMRTPATCRPLPERGARPFAGRQRSRRRAAPLASAASRPG
ncbi:MAG: hypothetical protein ACK559_30890, partial [bacterium]